jgi:hypothetical protein
MRNIILLIARRFWNLLIDILVQMHTQYIHRYHAGWNSLFYNFIHSDKNGKFSYEDILFLFSVKYPQTILRTMTRFVGAVADNKQHEIATGKKVKLHLALIN